MKDKIKLLFYGVFGLIGIIVIILGLFLLNNGNNEDKIKDNKTTEEIIKDNYEFRENDAINLIKKLFHSDNYKFEAKVNSDGLYVVTVTNTTTNSKYIYLVDPATKTYRLVEE